MDFLINEENAAEYLREKVGLPGDLLVNSLGGGVSNVVLKATYGKTSYVIKQPYENLQVDNDWPAEVTRVHNEAEAIRAYDEVIERTGLENVQVPSVVNECYDHHIIIVQAAPDHAVMWKRKLLDGQVDLDVAEKLGEILGTVHESVRDRSEVRNAFSSKKPFKQLRTDPYHRTTARRHPDVSELILEEMNRVLSVNKTLVHGDYSPKNVLVDYEESSPVSWILDFEVAHWGDPSFDTAFMMNHLFIKSVFRHSRHLRYVEAVNRFWKAYNANVSWNLERDTVRELGVLMLARMDGKSPVEYVKREQVAESLRRVAKTILKDDVRNIDDVSALTGEEARRL